MPILMFFGRLLANSSRSLNTEIRRKMMPEMATMPNACPYVASPFATIAATRFGMTSTGASAIGALAKKPIAMQAAAVISAVQSSTPVRSMPGTALIAPVMYARM